MFADGSYIWILILVWCVLAGVVSGWCSSVVYARLVLDLLWCIVSDLVPDLVPCVYCGRSGHWSDLLPGVDLLVWVWCVASGLVSCLVAGIWSSVWSLKLVLCLVSGWGAGPGVWSWCLVCCLVAGSGVLLVSGLGVWCGVWLLVLVWCEVSGLVTAFDCDCDPHCDWDAHVYDLNLYFKFLWCSDC